MKNHKDIQNLEANISGKICLLLSDHQTGRKLFGYQDEDVIESSSTIKVNLTKLIFEDIKNGPLMLDTILDITAADRHFGAGVLLWTDCTELTVAEHLKLIAYYSECVSTNVLIRRLGSKEHINKRLDELGYLDTRLIMPVFAFDDMPIQGVVMPQVGTCSPTEACRAFNACFEDPNLGQFYKNITAELHESWFDLATKQLCIPNISYWHKTGSMIGYGPRLESVFNAVGVMKTSSGVLVDFALYTRGYADDQDIDAYRLSLVSVLWALACTT